MASNSQNSVQKFASIASVRWRVLKPAPCIIICFATIHPSRHQLMCLVETNLLHQRYIINRFLQQTHVLLAPPICISKTRRAR